MIIANIAALAILILLLITSLKNRIFAWILVPLAVLFFLLQVSSVMIGGGFVDHQFIAHFNVRDIRAMADMFWFRVVVVCFLAVIAIISLYRIRRKVETSLFYADKRIRYSVLMLSIVIMSFPSGILYSAFITSKIYTASNSSFEASRLALGLEPYVTAGDVKAEKGHNIIILSLESLESGYLSEKYAHLTPNIRELRNRWSYVNMHPVYGCGWTSASMYAVLTGLPSFFKGEGNSYFQDTYGSKIPSLGDILHDASYDTKFYINDAEFAGTNDLLNTFKISDIVDKRNIEARYGKGLGAARDKDLFDAAKMELMKRKENGGTQPFALFISTVDTHHPDGILDDRFKGTIPDQPSTLEFMVSAVDRMVGDFVRFAEDEGFLENTTIFIFPDHLKMGDPSMLNGTGERSLYLISNAASKDLNTPEHGTFSQLDLPGTILKAASVKHNVKFLSDFVAGDRNKFVLDHISLLTALNTRGLLRKELWVDDLVVASSEKGARISFGDAVHKISRDTLEKFITRMAFSQEMRLVETDFIPADNRLLPVLETGQIAVDVHLKNDTIVGILQRRGSLPVLKTGTSEVSFHQTDINVLSALAFRADSREAATFEWTDNEPIEIGSSHEEYSEYRIELPYDVIGGFIEIEYSATDGANPYVILYGQPYQSSSLAVHDNIPVSIGKTIVRLPIRKALSNSLLIFRNWSTKGTFSVSRYSILGVGFENDHRFLHKSENADKYARDKDRFIAHAGGSVNGDRYTNSLEALNYNYDRGFRLFELDILETSDAKFVAAHDWNYWAGVTGFSGSLPVSEEQFLKQRILGKYTPLNMSRINEWFRKHPDAVLVTDKINSPARFAREFVDKDRLMMELFSIKSIIEAKSVGIKSPMMTGDLLNELTGDRIDALKKLGVTEVALSRASIAKNFRLLERLKKNGVKVYVFHVNFEPGKDEKYVVDFEMDYVYGLYADDWTFN
jgi:Sulfatase